jgi:hypothetical protein
MENQNKNFLEVKFKDAPLCQNLWAALQEPFAFLFERYGFRLVHHEEGLRDACLLVLESAQCRGRFTQERGLAQLSIGTKAAKLNWDEAGHGGAQGWYDLDSLLDFVTGRPIEAPMLKRIPGDLTSDGHLARLAGELEPHSKAIFELMAELAFAEREPELTAFLKNRREAILGQIRKHYGGRV